MLTLVDLKAIQRSEEFERAWQRSSYPMCESRFSWVTYSDRRQQMEGCRKRAEAKVGAHFFCRRHAIPIHKDNPELVAVMITVQDGVIHARR